MATGEDLFWYLLLAHYSADYVLQPDWMARGKARLPVLGLHIAIHIGVMGLVTAPAGRGLWPYLLGLAAVHFSLDRVKTWVSGRCPERVAGPYLLDQAAHILTIGLAAGWAASRLGGVALAGSRAGVVMALGYLLATYVWYISERVLASRHPAYQQQVIRLAWPRMLVRAALLTALLLVFQPVGGTMAYLSLPLAAAALLPGAASRLQGWPLWIDVGVALAAAGLVISQG